MFFWAELRLWQEVKRVFRQLRYSLPRRRFRLCETWFQIVRWGPWNCRTARDSVEIDLWNSQFGLKKNLTNNLSFRFHWLYRNSFKTIMDKLNPINAQWPNFPAQSRHLDQRPFSPPTAISQFVESTVANLKKKNEQGLQDLCISAISQDLCSLTQADNFSNSLILRLHRLYLNSLNTPVVKFDQHGFQRMGIEPVET